MTTSNAAVRFGMFAVGWALLPVLFFVTRPLHKHGRAGVPILRVHGTRWLAIGLALLIGTVFAEAARADDVKHELIKHAPKVLQHCREKGYQNVGILKFRIRKGQGQETDNAGPLNLNLADQLELALIMANSVKNPVGIVHNASAVAANIQGANHLTREGREKLFTTKYPLAWGTEQVTPDAFLIGVVDMSGELRKLTVGLATFSRTDGALEKVAQFEASPDVGDLVEAGESFVVRGLFDQGKIDPSTAEQLAKNEVVKSAVHIRQSEDKHPLADPQAVASLEIRYNNRAVPVEFREGKAFVREPQEGQKISFVLQRKNPADKQRYGVVLKVNGENTLERQRLKDADCRKWILEPGDAPITLHGFQMTDDSAQAFRVLSKTESKAREMDYGRDVGTISFVVFREQQGEAPPPNLVAEDAEDFAILSRGVFPSQPVPSLDVLKQQLLTVARRGLIVEGERIGAATRRVKFQADPTPVQSATITYYSR